MRRRMFKGRRPASARSRRIGLIVAVLILGALVTIMVPNSVHAAGNPYFTKENGATAARFLGVSKVEGTPRAIQAPRPSTAAQKRLLIVLDPGHGGKDAGATSPDGSLKEKDVALTVARSLKRVMEKTGRDVKVFLTRDDDTFLALRDRTALANSLNADLFISIHCNSNPDGSARGVEAYYLEPHSSKVGRKGRRVASASARKKTVKRAGASGESRSPLRIESVKFARALVDAMSRSKPSGGLRLENRGVRPAPMNVLSGARMPAVLVECGFMSNKADRKKLRSAQFLNHIALSMAKGIGAYFRDGPTGCGMSSAIAGSMSQAGLRIAESRPR